MPELRRDLLSESNTHALLAAAAMPEASEAIEEEPWVKLGAPSAVVSDTKWASAISAAETLFYASPLAHYIIEQRTNYIVGDGFELTSSNPNAAKILREFWHSPVNTLPQNLHSYIEEFFLYGRMLFAVKVNEIDGFVSVTYVPPQTISSVEAEKGLPGIPRVVKLAASEVSAEEPSYSVISWKPEKLALVGDAFYFRLGSDLRGFPCLLPLVDFLRAWESFTYNYLVKRANWDAIWWKVVLQGYTEDQIKVWLKEHRNPPAPGSMFATNERCEYTLVQPNFRESVLSEDGGFYLNFLLGSSGLTELAQVPRGTQRERGELLDPVAKGLSTRQSDVRSCFSFMGTFVLQEAIRAGRLKDGTYDVQCQAPQLGVRDFQRASGALSRFVDALTNAVANEWIAKAEAAQVFRDMLASLGMIERTLQPMTVPEEVVPESKL